MMLRELRDFIVVAKFATTVGVIGRLLEGNRRA